jgi:hypothetical protein
MLPICFPCIYQIKSQGRSSRKNRGPTINALEHDAQFLCRVASLAAASAVSEPDRAMQLGLQQDTMNFLPLLSSDTAHRISVTTKQPVIHSNRVCKALREVTLQSLK